MSAELDAWRKGGTFFLHHGHRIFFRDRGNGPILILLHGFPSASFDFAAMAARLEQRFRVIACDLIGFGFSEKPKDYPYSVKDQGALVLALAQRLGLKSAHLFAHDYGVSVAQELVARMQEATVQTKYTLRIESVCYLNGGLFPEMHRPRRVQTLLAGPFGKLVAKFTSESLFRKGFSEVFGPATPPSEAFLKDTWALLNQDDGRKVLPQLIGYMAERQVERARWVACVEAAPMPQRLINGTFDPVSGGHLADRFAERVPNADVVRLANIGHYPQVEAPDAVFDAFVAFHTRLGTPMIEP